MLNRLTDTLNFQTQALTLRAERQRVLASNIANADTPGYQARDMDFQAALRAATAGSGSAAASAQAAARTAVTQPGHLHASAPLASDPALRYATPSQTNLDSNSVDMDRERASFADNAVHYEATLRFINGSVKTLMSAITGQ